MSDNEWSEFNRCMREANKEYKQAQIKGFKNAMPLLEQMGLKPYWGKGGNWFNIYNDNKKYYYSPKSGKFKVQKGDWYKIGGFTNLVDFFKRDELLDRAKYIVKEVNQMFNSKRRVNKHLITLLALGRDSEYILSKIESLHYRYGRFEWDWIDNRLLYSF